ncbi:MAG TPA: copper chaperone PCu(A)C, partial [Rhodospirillales bacterium]|nr:copper chaperone PCu(A)C [Rhodospirillales bacterium]
TTLQPGGLHIMFMDLSAPLAAGGIFPLTLTFAEAGAVNVTVNVKDVAAMGQGSGDHGAMGGHGKPAESGY